MNDYQLGIYYAVEQECKKNPWFLKEVILAGTSGVRKEIEETTQYAVDMEVLASSMMFMAGTKRVSPNVKKQVNNLALSKLEKHYKKNLRLRWDSDLEFAKEDENETN